MIRFSNMINSPADIRNTVVYDVGAERKQREVKALGDFSRGMSLCFQEASHDERNELISHKGR